MMNRRILLSGLILFGTGNLLQSSDAGHLIWKIPYYDSLLESARYKSQYIGFIGFTLLTCFAGYKLYSYLSFQLQEPEKRYMTPKDQLMLGLLMRSIEQDFGHIQSKKKYCLQVSSFKLKGMSSVYAALAELIRQESLQLAALYKEDLVSAAELELFCLRWRDVIEKESLAAQFHFDHQNAI